MANAPFVTAEARALIGKEDAPITSTVSKQDIRRLAIAVGDLNPLYLDEDIARKSRYGGIIAHPIHYAVQQPVPESQMDKDGMALGRSDLPMKFSNHMAGGKEVEFFLPIQPGDTITSKRKIVDITERQSSKGGWIAIITRQTTYTNQKGEVVVIAKEVSTYS